MKSYGLYVTNDFEYFFLCLSRAKPFCALDIKESRLRHQPLPKKALCRPLLERYEFLQRKKNLCKLLVTFWLRPGLKCWQNLRDQTKPYFLTVNHSYLEVLKAEI